METTIKIGTRVQRNQPGDYTHGRRGNVIEILGNCVRVIWNLNPDGSPMKPAVRTWVNVKRLINVA